MWGFTDRYSWIPLATGHPDAPLIFDGEYRAKPAYYGLVDVLSESLHKKVVKGTFVGPPAPER